LLKILFFVLFILGSLYSENLDEVEAELEEQIVEMSEIAKESDLKNVENYKSEKIANDYEAFQKSKENEPPKIIQKYVEEEKNSQKAYFGLIYSRGASSFSIENGSETIEKSSTEFKAYALSLLFGVGNFNENRFELVYSTYGIRYPKRDEFSYGVGFRYILTAQWKYINPYLSFSFEYLEQSAILDNENNYLEGGAFGVGAGTYFQIWENIELSIGYEVKAHVFQFNDESCDSSNYFNSNCEKITFTYIEDLYLMKVGISYRF
jgi:hypothetical protein